MIKCTLLIITIILFLILIIGVIGCVIWNIRGMSEPEVIDYITKKRRYKDSYSYNDTTYFKPSNMSWLEFNKLSIEEKLKISK